MNPAEEFYLSQRVTDAELGAYIDPKDVGKNVVSIINYSFEVGKRLMNPGVKGDRLPWKKTHTQFGFRPGETTLWVGINGHGKSAVTSQVALWLAIQGRKSCIASFEMHPVDTLERMVKQGAGTGSPSMKFVADFFAGLCSRMWIYDRLGKIDPKMLFAAIRYCAHEKKTTHFFVDSLMKCVRGSDDYNRQKDFVDELMAVGRETGTHIHLVHHSKKLADESRSPGKFDARGAGEITDLIDNVFIIWRNKQKERENLKAMEMGQALNEETPDFLLSCEKQRNHPWEGVWALWGDTSSWHFRESMRHEWSRGYEIPEYQQRIPEPGALG